MRTPFQSSTGRQVGPSRANTNQRRVSWVGFHAQGSNERRDSESRLEEMEERLSGTSKASSRKQPIVAAMRALSNQDPCWACASRSAITSPVRQWLLIGTVRLTGVVRVRHASRYGQVELAVLASPQYQCHGYLISRRPCECSLSLSSRWSS